jgi:8-oxo-dGTP pyrophosphatase MutT (NUDIX family)
MVQLLIYNRERAVLLLQRHAELPVYPWFWELPVGKAQPSDATLLHSAIRVCKEKTGLDVTEISGAYDRLNTSVEGGESLLQITFTVKVRHTENVSTTERHGCRTWCAKENIEEINPMGALTEHMVRFGFRFLDGAAEAHYDALSPV